MQPIRNQSPPPLISWDYARTRQDVAGDAHRGPADYFRHDRSQTLPGKTVLAEGSAAVELTSPK